LDKAPGGDLLLHGKATLPSAHARFTSEFGMGSGGTTPLWPPGKGWEQRIERQLHILLKRRITKTVTRFFREMTLTLDKVVNE
jgi:hypothetical protein